ncbi:PEP-CTERM sorting domain-containing protein [Pseudoduganella sp. R-34]|uniref:PEP-CTERM sorting domain-containing protein n=1 Tax=Pseudoduganella sp. R-34 TaxID=3404062 RepID=UPI003CFB6BE6
MPRFLRLFFSVLALLAWSAHVQGAPAYSAFKFDGQFTPQILNDLGQVAGVGQDGRPVIWNPDGSVQQLAGSVSQLTITGFNNRGTVVGNAVIPGYSLPQPVAWRDGGAVERLPFQGLGGFTAGVNNRGDIIGYMAGASGTGSGQVGFVQWGDGSTPQLFDNYLPQMINDHGLVIGQLGGDWGLRGWQDGVFAQEPYSGLFVRALNNEGRLAGMHDNYHAFSLIDREGQRDIRDLWSGFAHALNDTGSVVGETELSLHAMLWFEDRAYNLDHLWNEAAYSGWTLLNAWDINNDGAILASALGPQGGTATFLLSPVPEPQIATLLLAGLALLALRWLAQRKLAARLASSSLLALLACSAYAQEAPAYRAFRFDGQFAPKFLNDAGQVAGLGPDGKPLIWNRDGSLVHLPSVAGELTLTGFNNQGTVIGNITIPGFTQSQPVRWRNGGEMELLQFAGMGGYAAGINNRGDVVGYRLPGTSGPIGFIQWGDGSAPQVFDDYAPYLINDLGYVIGGHTGEFGARSWYNGNFGDHHLAYDFYLLAVNSEGRVAGYQENASAFTMLEHGSKWDYQELWSDYAYDINDAGSVVGETDYRRAMLWYRDRPYVLDHLWNETEYAGWFLQGAWDINASGQILARGVNEWDTRGTFLLSPVPEPTQGALLLAGLALLGSLRLKPGRRAA